MTPRQRTTYHRQYVRWHAQQERKSVRVVMSRFGFMLNALTYSLKQSGVQITLTSLDALVTQNQHLSMLEAIYTTTGFDAAQNQYNRLIPPKKAAAVAMLTKDRDVPSLPDRPKPSGMIVINHRSEQWRQRMVYMARSGETASRVTSMTEKTRQLVRDVLTSAAEQALSLPKLIKNLRSVVVDKVRATLIARTETTRAANAGHEAGAASTLLILKKIWIATADGRTRQDHLEMIGKAAIPSNEYFVVGGVKMKYPGDPAGGAKQCCHCRCVCSWVPVNINYD